MNACVVRCDGLTLAPPAFLPLPAGVYWQRGSKWQAQFTYQCRNHIVGSFPSELEAAQAYDAAVSAMVPDGILNFLPVRSGVRV